MFQFRHKICFSISSITFNFVKKCTRYRILMSLCLLKRSDLRATKRPDCHMLATSTVSVLCPLSRDQGAVVGSPLLRAVHGIVIAEYDSFTG